MIFFVCQLLFKKRGKSTPVDRFPFLTTMRGLTHRLQHPHLWAPETTIRWGNSPDIALNDFFLFPYVKNKLGGQCFSIFWRYLNYNGKSTVIPKYKKHASYVYIILNITLVDDFCQMFFFYQKHSIWVFTKNLISERIGVLELYVIVIRFR